MPDFWPRAILHVDMDAFYASVEQHDDPSLRGKPVIVGGSAEGRGVVSAASYEARAFGVHSAMPTARARRLCPGGVFLPVRMERYQEVSAEVHAVFAHFTPAIQPVSVDEAFLDITGCQRLFGRPPDIARALKDRVRDETGLTASVGVAPTRFVAKVASDLEKPDGLVVIPQDDVLGRLAPLGIERIWGVGHVGQERLHRLGIHTIADLRAWPEATLREHFGSGGADLYRLARGQDATPVVTREPEKSVSNENTFAHDIEELAQLLRALRQLSDKVGRRLRKKDLSGRVVQLKVRYDDFSTVTRRVTLPAPTCLGAEIFAAASDLLRSRTEAGTRPVRLIGVGVSHFRNADNQQGQLFGALGEDEPDRMERLERAADRIRDKLGDHSIGRGSNLSES